MTTSGGEREGRTPEWLVLLLLAVLALALRLVVLAKWAGLPVFHSPQGDELNFHQTAQKLLAGEPVAAFLYQPLYSYFLVLVYRLFGVDVAAARTVQLLLGVGTTLLFYGLGRELARGNDPARARWAGRLSALLAAAYGPQVFFEAQLLAPALVVPLLAGSLWALVAARGRQKLSLLMPAGLCLGLATMARPNLVLVYPVLAVWWCWARVSWRRRLAGLAVAVAATWLGLLPSWLHNLEQGHWWIPVSSSGGHSFFIGNNPDARGGFHVPRGWPIDDTSHQAYRRSLTAIAERESGRSLSPAEVSDYWYAQGLRFWKEQPGRALSLAGWKAMLLVNADERPIHFAYVFAGEVIPPLRFYLSFGVLFPLAVLGLWPAGGRWRGRRLLGGVGLLYGLGLVAFYVADRYRIVMLPALVPLAAVGLVELYLAVRRGGRAAGARLLVLGLSFGLTQVPVTTELQNRKAISTGYNVMGVAAGNMGNLSEARRWFEQSVLWAGPGRGAMVRTNLGLLLERLGDIEGARAHYLEATRASRRARAARRRLALLAERRGDWAQALRWWRELARLHAEPEAIERRIREIEARQAAGSGEPNSGPARPEPPPPAER